MEVNIFSVVPIEVWQDSRLSKEQIRVLGALLSFRSKNTDWVWPGRNAVAERCGMHVSNVSQATTALCGLGWLEKEGDGRFSRSCRYRITVPVLADRGNKKEIAESATSEIAESATLGNLNVADSAICYVADSARGKEETTEHTTACAGAPARGTDVAFDAVVHKFEIEAACYDQWVEVYRRSVDPAHWSVDRTTEWIEAELAKAEQWLTDPASPKRVTKYRNWRRFVEGWLNRSSERLIAPRASAGGKR